MKTVNVHEAKTQLSRLLRAVVAGEEVLIARAGKPVAKLVAVPCAGRVPKLGTARGEIEWSETFLEADKEIENLFHGDEGDDHLFA